MVTHDLDTLFALSTRIAVLAEKHVIAIGPTRDVLKTYPFEERLGTAMIVREPVGVVGMITAWNYPMLLAGWKGRWASERTSEPRDGRILLVGAAIALGAAYLLPVCAWLEFSRS